MSDPSKLFGTWRTDPNDDWSLREYGDVSLEFTPDGRLIYTVHSSDRDQTILLSYRVKGNLIITDQPSSPRQEESEYFFTADSRLAIKEKGQARAAFYVRQP